MPSFDSRLLLKINNHDARSTVPTDSNPNVVMMKPSEKRQYYDVANRLWALIFGVFLPNDRSVRTCVWRIADFARKSAIRHTQVPIEDGDFRLALEHGPGGRLKSDFRVI